MEGIEAFVLPFELTNGNTGRGGKWFNSAKIRKQLEMQLRSIYPKRKPFDFPVVVHVTRVLGKGQRLWDSSSIGRGNWKEIEDAMVAIGFFHDDSPKFITETRFFQDPDRKSLGPVIEVEIFRECDDEKAIKNN